jgi:hypothetical protein
MLFTNENHPNFQEVGIATQEELTSMTIGAVEYWRHGSRD